MVSSINMFHGFQHGLWWQYRPLDINMALCHNPGHGHHHSSSRTGQGHHSFRGQHISWISAWPSVVTRPQTSNTAPGCSRHGIFLSILAFFIAVFPLRVFSFFISVSYTWVIIIKSVKVTLRESDKDKLL